MSLKKTTINDVAAQAGVSVTTVSMVLSGKGRISSVTSERVHEAIELLGYVPNRSATMLRGGGSGAVGLIVRDLCTPFYAEMIAGLSDALEQQGKLLVLAQSGAEGHQLQRSFDMLVAQGVEGIVLAGGVEGAGELSLRAQELGVAMVCASRASTLEELDAIRPDNMQAAKMATEYLIKRGHRAIAWLGGSAGSVTRAERVGGYCSTLMQHGLPLRSEWVIECADQQRDAAERAHTLLQHHPAITAVLCYNAAVAMGCYFGAQRSGRRIGGEVSAASLALVGFGDAPEAELTDPPLTFITSSAREIGRNAAIRLLRRIQDPLEPVQNVIVPARLVERLSA